MPRQIQGWCYQSSDPPLPPHTPLPSHEKIRFLHNTFFCMQILFVFMYTWKCFSKVYHHAKLGNFINAHPPTQVQRDKEYFFLFKFRIDAPYNTPIIKFIFRKADLSKINHANIFILWIGEEYIASKLVDENKE